MLFVNSVDGMDFGIRWSHKQVKPGVLKTTCAIYGAAEGEKITCDASQFVGEGSTYQYKRNVSKALRRQRSLKGALQYIVKDQRLPFWEVFFLANPTLGIFLVTPEEEAMVEMIEKSGLDLEDLMILAAEKLDKVTGGFQRGALNVLQGFANRSSVPEGFPTHVIRENGEKIPVTYVGA